MNGTPLLPVMAALALLARGGVPPTANLTEPGEGIEIDLVTGTARARSPRFALGGQNAVLAFAAA
jgi:3-oxoacyl-(acyl-carrier-protein) synthase